MIRGYVNAAGTKDSTNESAQATIARAFNAFDCDCDCDCDCNDGGIMVSAVLDLVRGIYEKALTIMCALSLVFFWFVGKFVCQSNYNQFLYF